MYINLLYSKIEHEICVCVSVVCCAMNVTRFLGTVMILKRYIYSMFRSTIVTRNISDGRTYIDIEIKLDFPQ